MGISGGWRQIINSSSSRPLPQKCLVVRPFFFFLLLDFDAQSCCGGGSFCSAVLHVCCETGQMESGTKRDRSAQQAF